MSGIRRRHHLLHRECMRVLPVLRGVQNGEVTGEQQAGRAYQVARLMQNRKDKPRAPPANQRAPTAICESERWVPRWLQRPNAMGPAHLGTGPVRSVLSRLDREALCPPLHRENSFRAVDVTFSPKNAGKASMQGLHGHGRRNRDAGSLTRRSVMVLCGLGWGR